MITAELSTEQQEMWRTFFDDNHADLALVAETLLRYPMSPERVLRKALSNLEGSSCEMTFGQAIHAVIDTAIEYNRETGNSPLQATTPLPVKLRVPGMLQNCHASMARTGSVFSARSPSLFLRGDWSSPRSERSPDRPALQVCSKAYQLRKQDCTW
jgi:hypothetical protein